MPVNCPHRPRVVAREGGGDCQTCMTSSRLDSEGSEVSILRKGRYVLSLENQGGQQNGDLFNNYSKPLSTTALFTQAGGG